jgi:hypothetical protein
MWNDVPCEDRLPSRGPGSTLPTQLDPKVRSILTDNTVSENPGSARCGVNWPRGAHGMASVTQPTITPPGQESYELYWIVNLERHLVERYTRPEAATGRYTVCEVFAPGEFVPVVIEGRQIGRIAVADLLPIQP